MTDTDILRRYIKEIEDELNRQHNFYYDLHIYIEDYPTPDTAELKFSYDSPWRISETGTYKYMNITAPIEVWIANGGRNILDALFGAVDGWELKKGER